jgi:LysR family cyn operon transcriptional activator
MELRHLRYFRALSDCLNFTRAAERVHVTQSTLSHQIRQLEDELGVALFDRVGRRVMLTAAGEMFLEYCLQALDAIDRGITAINVVSSAVVSELRVGVTQTSNRVLVPQCLARFIELYPGVRVAVEEMSAETINVELRARKLDLGISYRPADSVGASFEPLYDEELVLMVSRRHHFAGRRRVRMAELSGQRLTLLHQGFTTRQLLDRCFGECGASPLVVAEFNTINPMLELVRRTDAATIVAPGLAAPDGELCAVQLESPTPMRTTGILSADAEGDGQLHIMEFKALLRREAARRSPGFSLDG